MCAAHDLEVDGIGFRLGPVVRLPDGGYGFPLRIWDTFTGDEIYTGQLDVNYNYSTAEWRILSG